MYFWKAGKMRSEWGTEFFGTMFWQRIGAVKDLNLQVIVEHSSYQLHHLKPDPVIVYRLLIQVSVLVQYLVNLFFQNAPKNYDTHSDQNMELKFLYMLQQLNYFDQKLKLRIYLSMRSKIVSMQIFMHYFYFTISTPEQENFIC